MDGDPSLREFEQEVSRPDADIDIARAALVLARTAYPDLDVARSLARLAALARGAVAAGGTADPLERLHREIKDKGLPGRGGPKSERSSGDAGE